MATHGASRSERQHEGAAIAAPSMAPSPSTLNLLNDSAYKSLVDTGTATQGDILELAERFDVRYLQLQFTDVLGIGKNVEVPRSQFKKALDGQIMFDGSSIEGFVRIEESDMLLSPDLGTFRIYP